MSGERINYSGPCTSCAEGARPCACAELEAERVRAGVRRFTAENPPESSPGTPQALARRREREPVVLRELTPAEARAWRAGQDR